MAATTQEDLLQALLDRWEEYFVKGEPASFGTAEFAAINHYYAEFRSIAERAQRSLQGWGKDAPSATRRPVGEAAVATACCELIRLKQPLMALCFWMPYRTYCRPRELVTAKVKALLRPTAALGAPHLTVVLGAWEDGKPAKTGAWDDSVPFDEDAWLSPYLDALVTGRNGDGPLFPFTLLQYEQDVSKASKNGGMEQEGMELGIVPYTARHSDATNDLVLERRYGKPGILRASMLKLPAETRQHLEACARNLKEVFAGTCAPPVLAK